MAQRWGLVPGDARRYHPAMAGYATLGRVQGGQVRAIAWRWPVRAELLAEAGPPVEPAEPHPELVRPLREVAAERWADLREQWAMTTFYLFDPESWR